MKLDKITQLRFLILDWCLSDRSINIHTKNLQKEWPKPFSAIHLSRFYQAWWMTILMLYKTT